MSREIIDDMNAYFARCHHIDTYGIRIDRAAKYPRLAQSYYVHIRGGVACKEVRQVVVLSGVAHPCEYNNIMCGELGKGWSLMFKPRGV